MRDTEILIPRQPFMVMLSDEYYKKVVGKDGISHFYTFTVKDRTTEISTSVPDGCIDIMFYSDKSRKDLGAVLIGTLLTPHEVCIKEGYEYFGVRFLPGARPFIVDVSPGEVVEVVDFLTGNFFVQNLTEHLFEKNTFEERMQVFWNAYRKKKEWEQGIVKEKDMNEFLVAQILAAHGILRISDLAAETGYCERYVNRIFTSYIGISPKKFSKIIQFQNIMQELEQNHFQNYRFKNMDETGFYDEAHLIHEFKKFAGRTPGFFLKELQQESFQRRLIIL